MVRKHAKAKRKTGTKRHHRRKASVKGYSLKGIPKSGHARWAAIYRRRKNAGLLAKYR